MLLKAYQELLNYQNVPKFLVKYLDCPSLLRLKNVGYFCGMDYASNDIYNFKEYISRYDHSLNVSLITYMVTSEERQTIAGLFHDISTPCFSHVIDYMNKDYEIQESTEKYTEQIIRSDKYLVSCLEKDNIKVEDIVNFKNYSIVDNDRPKLCADRLDGVILPGLFWTKDLTIEQVKTIIQNIIIYKNEFGEEEIGFNNYTTGRKIIEVSNNIDLYCHSNEDNYMMELLSDITRLSIKNKYFTYEDLYKYNEDELFKIISENRYNKELDILVDRFESIKKDEIEKIDHPKIKMRILRPIVNKKRIGGDINEGL